jgi:integrase
VPLKLIPPVAGRSANYRIRGTHQRVYVDRTAGSPNKAAAQAELKRLRQEIERGAARLHGEPTFASAAIAYLDAGGEDRFVARLNDWFGDRPLREIDQQAIDAAAVGLYPDASPATRNRQVYSPLSAIMKRAGFKTTFARPKGARGAGRLAWLKTEDAAALLEAAEAVHGRFGAMCTFLLYTGCRLSEAVTLLPSDLHLSESFAYIRQTKNGDPRPVHLPPQVVAALANIEMIKDRPVFRLGKAGRLYDLLRAAYEKAGLEKPERVAFHIFRHTYGAWMRRYAGMDTAGLVATGAWKSRQAAAVYEHADVTEEARKADMLPTRAKSVRRKT